MKKLLFNLTLFFGINAILIVASVMASSRVVSHRPFTNGNAGPNLLFMPEDQHFDFVMLGTSHAEKFSLWQNHQRVESILGKKFINLSEGGGGGGLVNQSVYFQYFLIKGNSAGQLVYLIDPFVFYNDDLDFNPYVYEKEPFYWDFFYLAYQNGVPNACLWNYFRSKMKPFWLTSQPEIKPIKTEFLEKVDSTIFAPRMAVIYSKGQNEKVRQEKLKTFFEIIRQAEAQKMKIGLVIPPTLLGTLPATAELLQLLNQLKTDKGIEFLDAHLSLSNPAFYYDHDHLNTAGVEEFTSRFLKPFLTKKGN